MLAEAYVQRKEQATGNGTKLSYLTVMGDKELGGTSNSSSGRRVWFPFLNPVAAAAYDVLLKMPVHVPNRKMEFHAV